MSNGEPEPRWDRVISVKLRVAEVDALDAICQVRGRSRRDQLRHWIKQEAAALGDAPQQRGLFDA